MKKGSIFVNGSERSCIGSKILGVRGTSYVLEVNEDETYTLSVLNGTALVGVGEEPIGDTVANIQETYPRINPVASVNISAHAGNPDNTRLGEQSGLILGGGSLLLPLAQKEGRAMLYSNVRANTNLDGYWGASAELGYRFFTPSTASITTVYAGYDGYKNPSCFQSQISTGLEHEFRSRWIVSANGGIKLDDCLNSASYAMAQVAIPIAAIGDQAVHIGFSPYVLTGAVDRSGERSGESYAGGRIALNIPISNQFTFAAYGQNDGLYNTTVGGMFTYRFGIGSGGLVADPNVASVGVREPSIRSRKVAIDQPGAQQEAVAIPAITVGDRPEGSAPEAIAQAEVVEVKAGEEIKLDANGNILTRSSISELRFQQLVSSLMAGQNPPPEGKVIYENYKRLYQQSNWDVMSSTGAQPLLVFPTRNEPDNPNPDNQNPDPQAGTPVPTNLFIFGP